VLVGLVALVHAVALDALSSRLGVAPHEEPRRLTAVYVAELAPAPAPRVAPAAAGGGDRHEDRVADGVRARTAAATPVEPAASAPTEPAAPAPTEPAAPAPRPEAAPPAGAAASDASAGPQADQTPVPASPFPLETDPQRHAGIGPPPVHAGASGDAPGPWPPDSPTPVDSGSSGVASGSSLTPAEPLPAFEWPPSTRLSYVLTGQYRGELHGFAQVEWLREGERYQVHLEVIVGLPVAPLMSRRMSSDGRLGPDGLVPGRYDEVTRIAWRPERAAAVTFEATGVRLADGRWHPRPPGVQDTASQFVQMAYLFNLEPDRLMPGRTLALPLALPRRLDTWVYDILDEESIDTPFGPLATIPLKPRLLADRRDTLSAEVWIAPSLRFLPVRLRIRQDAETFVDLVLSRAPEIAAR
jgi:hypothetical protein